MAELAARIAALGRDDGFAAVGELLSGADDETVCSVVEDDLEKLNGGVAGGGTVVQFVFRGARTLAERGRTAASDRVLAVASGACVGRIFEDSPSADREAADGPGWAVVGDTLLEVLPLLTPRSIIDIAFRVLAELKAGGSVPPALGGFLPMLLDTLGMVGPVEITSRDGSLGAHDGGGSADASVTRTGAALKAYWVESACAYKWDPRASVRICALLRELVLPERLVGVVASRVLRQLQLADLADLPAMVYQLLLLARSGFKKEIVGGMFAFFDGLEAALPFNDAASSSADRRRWRELGDVEGTVMLHVGYSIKQDFELGDALVAYAKERCEAAPTAGASQALSPFSFACLLSLARIHRFEDTVTGLLRTLIVRGAHDRAMLAKTAWALQCLPATASDAEGLLAAVVVRSSYGWDQVTQSLTQLCLGVIDFVAAGPRQSAYGAVACAQVRGMCTATLQAAFSTHEFVRGEIVDQILSRAMFQTDSHVHFLGLLRRLVDDDPDGLRVYASRFIDTLDSISVMSHQTIEALLQAVSTIFLEDAQFRSSLVLVLRKILFAHAIDERRIALSGLFVLIKCSARALDACHRQTAAIDTADAAAARQQQQQTSTQLSVLLELMGLLRRCLTQQPEIRTASYQRLGALLDLEFVRQNPSLLGTLYGIFEVEMAKYYQRDRALESPVNIHACISPSTHKVTMPIASLLQCFAKLTTALASAPGGLPCGSAQASGAGGDMWADLCRRFAKAQMEDYELDPTGDYGLGNPAGLRNYNTARLVLGCVDAALEYALASCIQQGDGGVEEPAVAMELFSRFMRFGDVVCSRCLDDRKKRIVAATSDLSQMSLPAVLGVLELVLPDRLRTDRPEHPLNAEAGHSCYVAATAKAALWAANAAFVRHLLEVALARTTCRTPAGPSSNNVPLVEPEAHTVRKLAYLAFSGVISYYAAAHPGMDVELPPNLKPRAARGRSIVHLSADVLAACISTQSAHSASLDALLVALAQPAPPLFVPCDAIAPPPAHAAQCAATLMAGLRNAVSALLGSKPVAAKEAAALLAAAHIIAARLAELDAVCADSANTDARARIHTCLGTTAKWAFTLLGGEIPGDATLFKGVTTLLIACQPHLPPEVPTATVQIGPASDHQPPPPAVGKAADSAEFGLLSRLVGSVCRASRLLAGGDEEEEDEGGDDEPSPEALTQRTVPAVVGVATQWLKGELHQVDWATAQLRRTVQAELAVRPDDEDLGVSIAVERRVCIRIAALARILMQLLGCQLPGSTAGDQIVRALQELHRTFGQLTRAKLALPDLPITETFIDALSLICSDLNTHAYSMIVERYGSVGEDQGAAKPQADVKGKAVAGNKGKGMVSKPAKAKVMRNSTLVSSLVYQMELTEKYVMQLSTKLKTPLAHYLKRSTARDFRIRAAAVPEPVAFDHHHSPSSVAPEDMDDASDEPETAEYPLIDLPDPESCDDAPSSTTKRARRR
ncbi:hypothetical protein H4R19_001632 [Coemansia spiralis]|nr:hypothetical protein H4R19_001632 [Coemansia spiralis]